MWAQFELTDMVGHKTKGHASIKDVDAGKSTHWERAGNNSADYYAKQGAAMYFHIMDDMDVVSGMGMVAHAAAAWTARLHAWLHHGPASDTVGLPSTEEAKELKEELGSLQLEVEDEPGKRAIWAEAAAQEAMTASMG